MSHRSIDYNITFFDIDRPSDLGAAGQFIYDQTGWRAMTPDDLGGGSGSGTTNGTVGISGGFVGITGQVNIGPVEITSGSFEILDTGSSVVSNDGVSGIGTANSAGLIFQANPNRKKFTIFNLGTGVLIGRFSTSPATTGNLNFILPGGSAPYDGRGASISDTMWKGPVSITGIFGYNPLYVASEYL